MNPDGIDLHEIRERYRAERDRRLRADGIDQYTVSAPEQRSEDPYTPRIERSPQQEAVDVVIVGGGIGGLVAAATLRRSLGDAATLRVIDKAGDFGGVWYWNRYPGAQCDVESYIYLPLLEETGYLPKEKYSHAPEIRDQCRRVAEHFDVYGDALFQTEVTDLTWEETDRRWAVATDRGDLLRARFVVLSHGAQHNPRFPGIPGLREFAGATFHTSRWDYGYTGGDHDGKLTGLRDKRVGIIGTGATALQCVPHLAEWSQHLYVFQRTPSSVGERGNGPTDPDWARSLRPGWQRERQENFMRVVAGHDAPDLVGDGWTRLLGGLHRVERRLRAEQVDRARIALEVEKADVEIMEGVRSRIRASVQDPDTARRLLPYYRLMCKRPGFHDQYLGAFNRDNVTLVDTAGTGVERITPSGVVAAGRDYEIDCLVFATGFDVGRGYIRSSGIDVTGADGADLAQTWAGGMRTLHGFLAHRFPNCFFMGATQSAISPNFTHSLLVQADHIGFIVSTLLKDGHTRVEATLEAQQRWGELIDSFVTPESLEFQRQCIPSYFNNEGKAGDPNALQAGRHPDFEGYLRILEEWRSAGTLDGLAVD